MIEFNSVDKKLVVLLCSQRALSLYELHEKFEFSPIQLQDSCSRMERIGFLQVNRRKMTIKRNQEFFALVMLHRHAIYNRKKTWREIESGLKVQKTRPL